MALSLYLPPRLPITHQLMRIDFSWHRSVQPGHHVTHAPVQSDRREDPVQDQNDRPEEVLRAAQLRHAGAERQRRGVQ